MTSGRTCAALLALAFSLCACGPSYPVLPPSRLPRKPQAVSYVSPELFRSARFSPPPAPGSAGQKEDVAAVLELQKKRTAADCARAVATAVVNYDHLWGGNSPFRSPLPAEVKEFFRRLDYDAGEAVGVMKNKFARPRPFIAFKEVRPCIGKSGGYSYPSGHAAYARIFAEALGDIVPARKFEFLMRADGIASDRVLGGVHYPTDVAAGKLLGDEFHARLLANPAYLRDVEKMKSFLVK